MCLLMERRRYVTHGGQDERMFCLWIIGRSLFVEWRSFIGRQIHHR